MIGGASVVMAAQRRRAAIAHGSPAASWASGALPRLFGGEFSSGAISSRADALLTPGGWQFGGGDDDGWGGGEAAAAGCCSTERGTVDLVAAGALAGSTRTGGESEVPPGEAAEVGVEERAGGAARIQVGGEGVAAEGVGDGTSTQERPSDDGGGGGGGAEAGDGEREGGDDDEDDDDEDDDEAEVTAGEAVAGE